MEEPVPPVIEFDSKPNVPVENEDRFKLTLFPKVIVEEVRDRVVLVEVVMV
jgi:hypothetical protein